MSRRRLLGAALAWLAVVVSVSALVWLVISQAGRDLIASDGPSAASGAASTSAPPAQRTPRDRAGTTHKPPRTPSGTSSPAPESPSSPASPESPEPSPEPSSTPTSRPTTPHASGTPDSPTGSPSPSATDVRRTWQGQAGTVVAACTSSGIRLVSAQPANGFKVEVHPEDSRLEAEFEGREDESGTHVKVVARCVGGTPSFSVESEE
ncbi:cytoskeletal protein RodZ [Nocardioides sp. BE266]|uniref:hypothetical protein n=1 Tax=Nocardioides sp. BE266 TaxID=2817725 RepID=UPI00285AF833|nr:hypothetical protein [Nocardioides sp. BE266]MDR7253532.1 cytoskeletal protein RodZ [Nocardioides sp. BE266]